MFSHEANINSSRGASWADGFLGSVGHHEVCVLCVLGSVDMGSVCAEGSCDRRSGGGGWEDVDSFEGTALETPWDWNIYLQ